MHELSSLKSRQAVRMVYVSVFVSSPDTYSERKIESSQTVAQLKDKLTPITGIQPQYQVISLRHSSESKDTFAKLDDDSQTLEAYGLQEWNLVQVDNTDPNARAGEYNDLSAVEKFELTPEEYESRRDTVLSHLKANKLGRFAETPTNLTTPPPPPQSIPSGMIVGARCEVQGGDGAIDRRGTIRFVGQAPMGRGGVWVGVELDEPTGKGDGSVDGRRYFSCATKHAVFVRADKVTVGDFPEEDLFADDDEDEI